MSLSFSHYLPIYFSLFLFISLSLFSCFSIFLFNTHSHSFHYLLLSLYLSRYLFLDISFSRSLSINIGKDPSLSPSVPFSLYSSSLFLSHSLSVLFYLYLSCNSNLKEMSISNKCFPPLMTLCNEESCNALFLLFYVKLSAFKFSYKYQVPMAIGRAALR